MYFAAFYFAAFSAKNLAASRDCKIMFLWTYVFASAYIVPRILAIRYMVFIRQGVAVWFQVVGPYEEVPVGHTVPYHPTSSTAPRNEISTLGTFVPEHKSSLEHLRSGLFPPGHFLTLWIGLRNLLPNCI